MRVGWDWGGKMTRFWRLLRYLLKVSLLESALEPTERQSSSIVRRYCWLPPIVVIGRGDGGGGGDVSG